MTLDRERAHGGAEIVYIRPDWLSINFCPAKFKTCQNFGPSGLLPKNWHAKSYENPSQISIGLVHFGAKPIEFLCLLP